VWGLHALSQSQGQAVTFNLCGIIAVLGLFLTIFFTPETMGSHLDEKEEDDASTDTSASMDTQESADTSDSQELDDRAQVLEDI